MDDEYIEQFHKAEATFKHMYIYNPFERRMERLNELTEPSEERYCSNAGIVIDDHERALQLALGNLNPFTFKQLDNWHPDTNHGYAQATNNKIKRAKHKSIWQKNYQPRSRGFLSMDVIKDDKCALDFRKVDFSSKFINEEITENTRVEHAKPEEAEIFSMYQHKAAELIEPSAKRRRYSSDCINNDADEYNKLEATQNVSLANNNHNPFAKLQCTEVAKSSKNATLCENSSLLKILSPKKACCETNMRKTTSLKSPKSLALETAIVKSRFFSNNINEVSSIKKSVSRDLADEINSIEKQSQQKEEKLALLYDSPSPKNNVLGELSNAIKSDNILKIKKVHKNNESDELIEDSTSMCALKLNTSFIADAIVENESKNRIDNTITISDEDDIEDSSYENTSQTITPTLQKSNNSIFFFKSQEKQRLGLTRTKSKSALKSQKINGKSKSNSTITTATALLQNQTRLTMFGFQKRPTL